MHNAVTYPTLIGERFPAVGSLPVIMLTTQSLLLRDDPSSIRFEGSANATVLIHAVDGYKVTTRAQVVAATPDAFEILSADPYLTLRRDLRNPWPLTLHLPGSAPIRIQAVPIQTFDQGPVRGHVLKVSSNSLRAYRSSLRTTSFAAGCAFQKEAEPGQPAIEYRIVRSQVEFDGVVRLRTDAYRAAGKQASPNEMRDEFDPGSIVLAAFDQGRPVASLRLMPHAEGEPWEHDRFVAWPAGFPAKRHCTEITRVCADADYRRDPSLLMGLFNRAAVIVAALGRPTLVGCATDKLLPLYRRIGCKVSSHRFLHTDLGAIEHTLFTADVAHKAYGVGIGFATWVAMWRQCAGWMIFHRIVPRASVPVRTRFLLNQLAAPAAAPFIGMVLARKSHAHRSKNAGPAARMTPAPET